MGTRQGGASVVEAVMALAIGAIGLAVAAPSYGDLLHRNRVAGSMHMVMTDLSMARNTAIMRGTQVVVCPGNTVTGCGSDRDWSRGWMVFVDRDGNRRPEGQEQVLRVSSGPPASLQLRSTRAYLRYQADGRAAHSNLTINVCAGQALAGKLVVNNLGRVRSERPKRPTPCPA